MVPLGDDGDADDGPHLTRRDQLADTLEDMLDFESPSLNTTVGTATIADAVRAAAAFAAASSGARCRRSDARRSCEGHVRGGVRPDARALA